MESKVWHVLGHKNSQRKQIWVGPNNEHRRGWVMKWQKWSPVQLQLLSFPMPVLCWEWSYFTCEHSDCLFTWTRTQRPTTGKAIRTCSRTVCECQPEACHRQPEETPHSEARISPPYSLSPALTLPRPPVIAGLGNLSSEDTCLTSLLHFSIQFGN